jgi:hypothetical protein
MKNDVDQIADLTPSFDFAINESCYRYHECSGYQSFIEAQKPVFIIEYRESVFDENAQSAKESSYWLILKNRNLDSFVKTN